jgi:flavin reductase (DIM6/NTAB) family NADH-FMN oxidoreductase RutF
MKQDTYFYDPAGDHGLAHDPFKAIVAPRVIGWISSCNENGQPNLAPYSFFGMFAANPKVIAFSSEGYKDTIRNIEKTGEFTWNFTSAPLVEAMNKCSAPVDATVNEFELSGLTPVPGVRVKVPRVGESPAALECKLLQIIQLKDLNGQPMSNWMVLGQVVGVHIQREYLVNGMFDLHAAQPVLRAGYRGDYAEIGNMFELIRPTA